MRSLWPENRDAGRGRKRPASQSEKVRPDLLNFTLQSAWGERGRDRTHCKSPRTHRTAHLIVLTGMDEVSRHGHATTTVRTNCSRNSDARVASAEPGAGLAPVRGWRRCGCAVCTALLGGRCVCTEVSVLALLGPQPAWFRVHIFANMRLSGNRKVQCQLLGRRLGLETEYSRCVDIRLGTCSSPSYQTASLSTWFFTSQT